MLATLHRNRWVFAGLALLAACFAEMAHAAPAPTAPSVASRDRLLGVWGYTTVLPIDTGRGPAGYPGLMISAIVQDSPAHWAGLEPGLIIAQIDDVRITCLADVRRAVAEAGSVADVLIYDAYGDAYWFEVDLGDDD